MRVTALWQTKVNKMLLVSMETTDLASNGGVPVDITLQVIEELQVVAEYCAYIIPTIPVSTVAESIHNMSMEWLVKYGRPSKDVFAEVWQFITAHGGHDPIYMLCNDVGFELRILQNWFASEGYPNNLLGMVTPTGLGIDQVAMFINEVSMVAAGGPAFKNPRNGRASVSLEAQATELKVDYANLDPRPSRGKALAILDILRSHISNVADDYISLQEQHTYPVSGVEVDSFTDKPHCSHCGAVAIPDPAYVYEGAVKLDCVLCGTQAVVQVIGG